MSKLNCLNTECRTSGVLIKQVWLSMYSSTPVSVLMVQSVFAKYLNCRSLCMPSISVICVRHVREGIMVYRVPRLNAAILCALLLYRHRGIKLHDGGAEDGMAGGGCGWWAEGDRMVNSTEEPRCCVLILHYSVLFLPCFISPHTHTERALPVKRAWRTNASS